jgi:hypothetical protein
VGVFFLWVFFFGWVFRVMEHPVGFSFVAVFVGFSLFFCFLFGGPFVYSQCTLGVPYAFYNIFVYLQKKKKLMSRLMIKIEILKFITGCDSYMGARAS